jgi:hypothetical protein
VPAPDNDERKQAVIEAARKWIDRFGGQSAGARAADEQGTPILQQELGWAAKGQKIGLKLADKVAALYGTTPDGLAHALRSEEEMTLRDVPGWARAKAEAIEENRHIEDWVWEAIDHVVVPVALKDAKPAMAEQMAIFLQRWGGVSTVRKAIRSAKL